MKINGLLNQQFFTKWVCKQVIQAYITHELCATLWLVVSLRPHLFWICAGMTRVIVTLAVSNYVLIYLILNLSYQTHNCFPNSTLKPPWRPLLKSKNLRFFCFFFVKFSYKKRRYAFYHWIDPALNSKV